jgi:integrase
LADLYLARQRQSLRPRSFVSAQRHLISYAKPLRALPLAEIDRRPVAKLIASLGDSSGATTANMVRASLSACFSWGMREGLCASNPAQHTNKLAVPASRDRVLSDHELAAIWRGTEGDYSAIVCLLMLLGCRREEVGGLKWSEIDLGRAMISLPGERTKNGRAFDIPLAPAALAILQAQPRREGDHVFGRAGFKGWVTGKREIDKRVKIAPWRLHDLRRTVSTQMHERLGVAPHVVEAVLNHVSGHQAGVAGTYNKATYAAEKRRTLDRWAEHLLAIVEGRDSKIVPFATRGVQ